MPTTRDTAPRDFYVGLAIGQFWLSLVGTALIASVVLAIVEPTTRIVLVGLAALVYVTLVVGSVVLLRHGRRIPAETEPEKIEHAKAAERTLQLRFAGVIAFEVAVIAGVDAALEATGQGIWTVPATMFLVGLHFVALALVFTVRAYIGLGIAWMTISALTVAFVPIHRLFVGSDSAWTTLPRAGCGIATWVVVAYVLWTNSARAAEIIHD